MRFSRLSLFLASLICLFLSTACQPELHPTPTTPPAIQSASSTGIPETKTVPAAPPTLEPAPSLTTTPTRESLALRFPRLSKGINLDGWFWLGSTDDRSIQTRFNPDEFKQLRAFGFTYVRLPIDLDYLLDQTSPDLLNAHHLALLDVAVQSLLNADLAVLVDLHSTSQADTDSGQYSGRLQNPAFVNVFDKWWGALAAHLSQFPTEMIILGPMNEPSFPENALDWPPIQTHLIETIRANAPKNTIVATGLGGNLNDLLNLIPLADSNIVYDFHFYEPYPFTHQGANWSDPRFTPLRNVPYPSNPQAVATLLPQLGFPDSQKLLEDYGTSNWNAEAVTARIASDADWATLFKVPLICAEFGVLRDYAPPAGRAQWIKDVRTAFEANGIGWAMWEYDSNFGLATRDGQNVTIDADIARALGLDPSRWKTGN